MIAWKGEILIYSSNASSPVQIDYRDASHKSEIFRWIESFVAQKRLSGSLCFDFLEDESGEMFCIECNPRLHSNIVLLASRRRQAATAISRALEETEHARTELVVRPEPAQRRVHWTYNELARLLEGDSLERVLTLLRAGRDAVWDEEDPLPWLLLNHLQLPSLLAAAVISGHQWNIVNFCLGQLR